MKYSRFGKTDWQISNLCLGTVELGMRYGFYSKAEERIPSLINSIDLLIEAFDNGINFVDTAPVYGQSEIIVGKAVREWNKKIYLATKIQNYDVNLSAKELKNKIQLSIESSLNRLNIDYIDLLQVHSLEIKDKAYLAILDVLGEYKQKGIVKHIGATVYEEEEAKAVIENELISVLQLQYNLLDQRMAKNIFSMAVENDIALLSRSAFLKGVLTPRLRELPDNLSELKSYAFKAKYLAEEYNESLYSLALKFCLSNEKISSTLIGVRNKDELYKALTTLNSNVLDKNILDEAKKLNINSEIIDPRSWEIQ